MTSDERSELRGTVLDGRYRVGAPIGVGGTGVVFEATRLRGGETVVVKTLRPRFANQPDLCTRLVREAEVSRAVRHPSVLPAYDEGILPDGSPYVVFPLIRAESLSRFLRRHGHVEGREMAAILMRVASALHSSHQAGYVHRDIKPEHILLDRSAEGRLQVYLIDYGVCAAHSAPSHERERERGRVFGTPSYVSPEQASGNPYVDGRADLFGLGITAYECLTGRLPFSAHNVTDLLRRILREDAPRVRMYNPACPQGVDDIVAQLLARDPEARVPSARRLSRLLAPLVPNRALTERRLSERLVVGHYDTERRNTIAAA